MDTVKVMGVLVLASLVILTGCTTTGTGEGELTSNVKNQPETPVKFTWKSAYNEQRGTITATLHTVIYQGSFFQVTDQINRDILTPLWAGWTEGWTDWPYWADGSANDMYIDDYNYITQFISQYLGKVVANLSNSSGKAIRCRFNLNDPKRGMANGAQGECQLSDGSTIEAIINPS